MDGMRLEFPILGWHFLGLDSCPCRFLFLGFFWGGKGGRKGRGPEAADTKKKTMWMTTIEDEEQRDGPRPDAVPFHLGSSPFGEGREFATAYRKRGLGTEPVGQSTRWAHQGGRVLIENLPRRSRSTKEQETARFGGPGVYAIHAIHHSNSSGWCGRATTQAIKTASKDSCCCCHGSLTIMRRSTSMRSITATISSVRRSPQSRWVQR